MTDEMTGTNHRWGLLQADDVRRCTKAGCSIRLSSGYDGVKRWQRNKGGHWRNMAREPLPECNGTEA